MQKNQKSPNTPNSSGQNRAVGISTTTGQQEILKTGKHSKRQSKTPSEPSSTIKFKKSLTKVEAHGN